MLAACKCICLWAMIAPATHLLSLISWRQQCRPTVSERHAQFPHLRHYFNISLQYKACGIMTFYVNARFNLINWDYFKMHALTDPTHQKFLSSFSKSVAKIKVLSDTLIWPLKEANFIFWWKSHTADVNWNLTAPYSIAAIWTWWNAVRWRNQPRLECSVLFKPAGRSTYSAGAVTHNQILVISL